MYKKDDDFPNPPLHLLSPGRQRRGIFLCIPRFDISNLTLWYCPGWMSRNQINDDLTLVQIIS